MATKLKAVITDLDTGEIIDVPRPSAENTGKPLGDEVAEETVALAAETLSGDLRDAVLDMFKNRRKSWQEMAEAEKRDVAASIESITERLVGRACLMLAAGGRLTAPAELETYQQKGREIVAKLELFASPEAVLALNKACGSTVQLVFVDAAPFRGERGAVDIEPDQGSIFDQTEQGKDLADADFAPAD